MGLLYELGCMCNTMISIFLYYIIQNISKVLPIQVERYTLIFVRSWYLSPEWLFALGFLFGFSDHQGLSLHKQKEIKGLGCINENWVFLYNPLFYITICSFFAIFQCFIIVWYINILCGIYRSYCNIKGIFA